MSSLFRRAWHHKTTWLLIMVGVYISVSILTRSKHLKQIIKKKSFKYGSTAGASESKQDTPLNVISPVDLTLPSNQIKFSPINSVKQCFQFREGSPAEVADAIKKESEPLELIKTNFKLYVGSILDKIKADDYEDTVKHSAEEWVELYRDSIDFAMETIDQSTKYEPVQQCIFPAFNKKV